MSFFSLSQKNIDPALKNVPKIGPGAYDLNSPIKKIQPKGYAPFGCVEKKKSTLVNQNAVGPGLYQVAGQICKPSITKYENPNSIIIKINEQGWSQFKSKTIRFQQQANATQFTPGPGEYNYQRQISKQHSKDFIRSSIGEKIKEINLKNYLERRKPTLQTDPVKIHAEQQQQKTRYKGLSWSLNKKQRFSPLNKQPFQEEHKAQFIDKIRDDRKKQRAKSQSAVFASKSIKSHFQAEIYQTHNPFKIELRKMIDYKDDGPGPGSYHYQNSENKSKFKFYRHQFFGSTVERFKTEPSLGDNLGPGYYSPKAGLLNNGYSQCNMIRQEAEISRHSYIPVNSSQLGPGTYSVEKQKKHKASCKWVFGSKKPRFSEQSTIENNQQEVDQNQLMKKMKRQKQFEYRKEFLNSGNHATFASTSKRFENEKLQTQNISVGHYDVTQSDIASKVKKAKSTDKQKGRLHHSHEVSAPFMSTVDRFRYQQEEQQNHGHHDCWCLVKSVEKQVYEHQSSAFSSKQKRTVVFQNKPHAYSPAVGTYTKESSFVRNSFNSRFLKANESKLKKFKLLNAQKQNKKPSLSLRQQQISMIKIN